MKTVFVFMSLLMTHTAFAQINMECKNQDGAVSLKQAVPCKHCKPGTIAFDFVGGDGILADGIPSYEADMPGYIDGIPSAKGNQDYISLMDGGTWTIEMYFPNGFLQSSPSAGTRVHATMDSSYSDIMESELNDVQLDCTVQ